MHDSRPGPAPSPARDADGSDDRAPHDPEGQHDQTDHPGPHDPEGQYDRTDHPGPHDPDHHNDAAVLAPGAQPGRLTPAWRTMLALAWIGAIFAYAAVWQASVQLGIGLWWIGPRSLPTPAWVKMIPFLTPVAMIVAIGFNVRRLPAIGLLASGLAALIAIPDFSRSVGLAFTELAIAGALALVSAMSLTGLYRSTVEAPDSVAAP